MRTLSFKRPLAAVGIPFLLGAFLGAQSWLPWYLIAAAVILSAVLFAFFPKRKRELFFALILLLGALYVGLYQATRPALNVQSGQTVIVRGTVTDTRAYGEGSRFLLEHAGINGGEQNASVQVTLYYENEIADGDTVELRAICRSDSGAFFDADRYYYERGIDLNATGDAILLHEKAEARPLSYHFTTMRDALSDTIFANFSRENALFLQGMLLGVDEELSLETVDILKRSGARHLFVVSGLHLTLAVSLLYTFCRKLRLPIRLCAVLAVLAAFGVVLLTGCTVPALRAAFMTCVIYIGRLFFRRADAANSLFSAAILIVLTTPYSITSASFLLSFSAAAGVYILPPLLLEALAERFPKINHASATARSFAATITGSAAVFPASAWMLGGASLLSPLTNLLIASLLTPLLVSGMFGLCGIPLISECAVWIAELLLTFLRIVFSLLASIPFSHLGTRELYFIVWFAVAVVWLAVVLLYRRNAKTLLRHFLVLLLLLPLSMGVVKFGTQPYLTASAASASSADLLLLEHNGYADLIVKESRINWGSNALSLLRGRNVHKLRSLILLTKDSRSASAPAFLAKAFRPETILLYEENTLADHAETLFPADCSIVLLNENDRRVLYPGLDIRRSGESMQLHAANGEHKLILANTVPETADCWVLFSDKWEDLYLNRGQKAVMLSVPEDLEIQGGLLYDAQSAVITAYLSSEGSVSIHK